MAFEAARKLKDDWQSVAPGEYKEATHCYLMLDFSNGCKILQREVNTPPSIILGARLAYVYFIQCKFRLNFTEFLDCFATHLELLDITSVMPEIRRQAGAQDLLFMVVHIDEVQCIFDEEPHYKWDTAGKGLFKQLM